MGKHSYPVQPVIRREWRIWIYNVVLAVLPLLVAVGVVQDSLAPLIVGVAGAVLAVGTARTHITPPEVEGDA